MIMGGGDDVGRDGGGCSCPPDSENATAFWLGGGAGLVVDGLGLEEEERSNGWWRR